MNLAALRDLARRHAPDLVVLLKPAWFVARALATGPSPRDCVASFDRIRRGGPGDLDAILRSLSELPAVRDAANPA